MISFNIPPYVDGEEKYVSESINTHHICGDNTFTKKCEEFFTNLLKCPKFHLTTSGTSALEMACMLIDINPGDEVIVPSYTFSSTVNAIVIFGGVPVFVDVNPKDMNIDETKIETAITPKTKAIMVVHYAGVGCNMDEIMKIAKKHNLLVIEDAAQAVNAKYKGKYLGTIGDIGCFSFHETKNYSMGEGGGISINNPKFVDRADIIREKGTNRTQFINGQVDKYTWVDKGSSYLPSDILAAYLWPQLEKFEEINKDRVTSWKRYYNNLKELQDQNKLELQPLINEDEYNGHMFYIKAKDLNERQKLQSFLKEKGIGTAFHYIPLHSAPEGLKVGRMSGEDKYTTKEAERLLRLPMYYHLDPKDLDFVCDSIKEFYK